MLSLLWRTESSTEIRTGPGQINHLVHKQVMSAVVKHNVRDIMMQSEYETEHETDLRFEPGIRSLEANALPASGMQLSFDAERLQHREKFVSSSNTGHPIGTVLFNLISNIVTTIYTRKYGTTVLHIQSEI